MPLTDLRTHIARLEEKGELVRITKSVSTKLEVGTYEEEYDGKKAVLFESVAGFDIPIVCNIFNTRVNVAEMLGVAADENLSQHIITAADNPIPTVLVDDAPCKEIRIAEADVDLIKQVPTSGITFPAV